MREAFSSRYSWSSPRPCIGGDLTSCWKLNGFGFAVGPAVLQTFPDTVHGLDRDEPLCRQVDEYIAGEDREAAHDKLLVPMMLHYDPVGRHEGFEAGIGKIALDKAQARRPLLNDRCGW